MSMDPFVRHRQPQNILPPNEISENSVQGFMPLFFLSCFDQRVLPKRVLARQDRKKVDIGQVPKWGSDSSGKLPRSKREFVS